MRFSFSSGVEAYHVTSFIVLTVDASALLNGCRFPLYSDPESSIHSVQIMPENGMKVWIRGRVIWAEWLNKLLTSIQLV